jgi:hypothetical protein
MLDDNDRSTFVALRCDKTHVLFLLGDNDSFGFGGPEEEKMLHSLPSPIAEYGGAPTSEPDPKIWDSLREHFNEAHVGERWQLEVSAGARIPVVMQKPIEMKWGCDYYSYASGFIAEVPPDSQAAFASSPNNYFLIHKLSEAASSEQSSAPAKLGAMTDWRPAPEIASQIESAIVAGLKSEIAHERARGSYEDVRKQFEEQVTLGNAKLAYETQAFQLSPDGFPRLFVRARWMVDRKMALLMTLWVRVGPVVASEPVDEYYAHLLWLSAKSLTNEEVDLGRLPFVLNVFDRPDGYGDVLVYFPGPEGYDIHLLRYTDAAMVFTKISHGDGC